MTIRIQSINIDTSRSILDQIRLCFWAYLLLLIFEGAIRKWILPGLSDAFLVIRDPIVLYVFILSLKYKLLRNNIINILYAFSAISFILTLLLGHQNLFVATYGVRITLLHIPCIFIFGKALTREDIHLIGKCVLYISILMFLILLLQYFSPRSAWINRGVGGIGTAGFSGVAGYMRPSGTFSFTSGMAGFELLVSLFFFYYLYNNDRLSQVYRLNKIVLSIVAICFFFSIILCLSRSIIFQTLLMFVLMLLFPIIHNEKSNKVIYILLLIIGSFLVLYQFEIFKIAFDNVFLRFDQASKAEGDVIKGTLGDRYFGSFYRAFFETQNYSNQEIPFFGFGLGIGTKVGEAILQIKSVGHSFAFAEEEWSRYICEIGLLQGMLFLLGIRFIYPLYLAGKAIIYAFKNKDSFLFLSIAPFLLYYVKNQWATPSTLGFTVVLGGIFITAYNQYDFFKQTTLQ